MLSDGALKSDGTQHAIIDEHKKIFHTTTVVYDVARLKLLKCLVANATYAGKENPTVILSLQLMKKEVVFLS